MPDLDDPSVYNTVPKGNRPHSFTGDYVSLMLKRLHTWRQH